MVVGPLSLVLLFPLLFVRSALICLPFMGRYSIGSTITTTTTTNNNKCIDKNKTNNSDSTMRNTKIIALAVESPMFSQAKQEAIASPSFHTFRRFPFNLHKMNTVNCCRLSKNESKYFCSEISKHFIFASPLSLLSLSFSLSVDLFSQGKQVTTYPNEYTEYHQHATE